jgi:hypothetical protein
MESKHVNGRAYCRYAATPPIINSPLADQYGIEVFSPVSVEEGRYVKLIEEIDMKRGDESFSDFVAKAVRDYVKR